MAPVPYCKVCHDSGKDESIYTSHFIRENRDPNSKIVCPTLLSLECRYCSKPGHTVKYCKELKKKNQQKEKEEKEEKITHVVPKKCIPLQNMFAVLDCDDEDETHDLPPLVPYDLPPLVPYDLPPLVPYDLPPLVPYDLPPLVPYEMCQFAPIAPTLTFDDMPPLAPIAPTPPNTPTPVSVMSYKNIIQITREQLIKEEQEKWKMEERKEEEKKRRELAKKLEENRRIVEAYNNRPKEVFRKLNWADSDEDE